MSIRTILVILKCIETLNIRNLNLLTGLNDRLVNIIEKDNNKVSVDDDNFIEPHSIAHILNSLVKLEFIEYENYVNLEELFFKKSAKFPNSLNEEVLFSIIYAHFNFYTKLYVTSKRKNQTEDTKETEFDYISGQEIKGKSVTQLKINKGLR